MLGSKQAASDLGQVSLGSTSGWVTNDRTTTRCRRHLRSKHHLWSCLLAVACCLFACALKALLVEGVACLLAS